MPSSINFVRERQRKVAKVEILDQKILMITIMVFAVLLVLSTAAFFGRWWLTRQVADVQAQQKTQESAILQQQPIEESYTIFAHKLRVLRDLFGNRKNKQNSIAFFSEYFGSDVIVSQLSYNSEEEVLTFVLDSKDIFVLDTVFAKLQADELRSLYPTLQYGGLTRSQGGRYGLKLTVTLPKYVLEKSS
ncbi:MAG: hypothetical protein GW946_03030 [Candidatus Pacebacteria bacterium]|nr:hypothetical protein [Candidatus Paceibacterota bacterium]PIR60340.1 MAG: hypothetical protein COU67_02605 [Candidatus Pacebacteria bacterium CG10_big_fil_rev_8_21_14_0_10_44_54]